MTAQDEIIVLQALQLACKALHETVPELEAVAFVTLWRESSGFQPSSMIVTPAGPCAGLDQLLRLNQATLRLQQFCVEQSQQGVDALRELANNLAAKARMAHESQAQAQGPREPAADVHGNPVDDPA